MIISVSGRKSSGKSTLCKELIKRGFKRISFGDPLKEIVSQLYNIPIDKFYNQIEKEKELNNHLLWDKIKCDELGQILSKNIQFDGIIKQFKTIRESLQYIGTDIMRKFDNNIHIELTLSKINDNENYCIDDCRFLNEKLFLEKHKAITIFIIRPYFFDYSNHASEIELNWAMFDNIIINDSSSYKLLYKFNIFLNFQFTKTTLKCGTRNDFYKIFKNNNFDVYKTASYYNVNTATITVWCQKFLIPILRNKYSLNHKSFLHPTPTISYLAGLTTSDGCLRVSNRKNNQVYNIVYRCVDKIIIEKIIKELQLDKKIEIYKAKEQEIMDYKCMVKEQYGLTVCSPFIVENIKLWNIKPRKSLSEEPPDVIKNNNELMKYWIVGLIDGDGSIGVYKKKKGNSYTLSIRICSSKSLIYFIKKHFIHINSNVAKEKNKDLFVITFSGKYALQLYYEIYRGIGLERKWSRVIDYINYKKNKVSYAGILNKNSKCFEITSPNNEKYYGCSNLDVFCKTIGLKNGKELRNVACGKIENYKGWICKYISKNEYLLKIKKSNA